MRTGVALQKVLPVDSEQRQGLTELTQLVHAAKKPSWKEDS